MSHFLVTKKSPNMTVELKLNKKNCHFPVVQAVRKKRNETFTFILRNVDYKGS